MNRTRAIQVLTLPLLVLSLASLNRPASGASNSFSSGLASPTNSVTAGATTTVTVKVKCTAGSLSSGIIDVEIYNASGALEKKAYWSGQSLKRNQTGSYSFSWVRSTAGSVTVKAGVYAANWTPLYSWNNAAGAITFVTPPAPAAPAGLTASAGNAQVALSWTAISGATSYNVKRSTTSGSGYTTVASPTGTSYTDSSVTNGATYYYVVSAVNSAGESPNSAQMSATPQAPPPPPSGLPPYLALGLANDPSHLSWMTGSNIAWNYRYQYLCGGVNTADGWATWNTGGSFATLYMQNSQANGYIPVFTYYQLVQSNPNAYDENLDPKLQCASTMNAYFADWKLLMQKAGGFGATVIVHVEPDGWGSMQQTHGDNPVSTPVCVASSGFAEVAAYENNARGFAKALVALRNAYAPNVLLAWHASDWATNTDLILNSGDPVTIGTRTASFYTGLAANFDLIFYDPCDRDAGYYQYVYGDGGRHWWKDTDFDKYRQFIATITQATGRKGMLWQVPLGNTLYLTCNNTDGHYQDNRPQYFLLAANHQHLVDYAAAGIVAILFGRGAGGPSNYLDSKADGVSNPPAINGNTLISNVSDDDGGFLRKSAADYYLNGKVTVQ